MWKRYTYHLDGEKSKIVYCGSIISQRVDIYFERRYRYLAFKGNRRVSRNVKIHIIYPYVCIRVGVYNVGDFHVKRCAKGKMQLRLY